MLINRFLREPDCFWGGRAASSLNPNTIIGTVEDFTRSVKCLGPASHLLFPSPHLYSLSTWPFPFRTALKNGEVRRKKDFLYPSTFCGLELHAVGLVKKKKKPRSPLSHSLTDIRHVTLKQWEELYNHSFIMNLLFGEWDRLKQTGQRWSPVVIIWPERWILLIAQCVFDRICWLLAQWIKRLLLSEVNHLLVLLRLSIDLRGHCPSVFHAFFSVTH